MSALNCHPDVFCQGEIFHPLIDEHVFSRARKEVDVALRETDPIRYLREVMTFAEGARVVGFKIFQGHNDFALDYLLRAHDIKKIVLKRTNMLASFSSFHLAKKTNVWNLQDASGYDTPTMLFVPAMFEKYCAYVRKTFGEYFEVLRSEKQSFITLEYGQHILGHDFGPVREFLGLDDRVDLNIRYQRLNSDDIAARFTNPEEVLTCLEERGQLEWLRE